MLKARGPAFALAGLILVAVVGLGLDLQSRRPPDQTKAPQSETGQQPERTEDQKQNSSQFYEAPRNWMIAVENAVSKYLESTSHYCAQESTDKQNKWLQDFLCSVKITDVVIAVFSIFLVFVTVGLVIVGWRQAALLRQTARRQLRAYVFVDNAGMYNVTTPLAWEVTTSYKPTGAEITHTNFGPVCRMVIKNSGLTPAFDVVHWGQILIREFPLRSRLPKPGRPPPPGIITKSTIPPNGGISTKNVVMAHPLTADQVADLKRGTAAIYVDGYIRYRDAFRRKRRTNFRYLYGSFTGGVGITTEVTIADRGNEAT